VHQAQRVGQARQAPGWEELPRLPARCETGGTPRECGSSTQHQAEGKLAQVPGTPAARRTPGTVGWEEERNWENLPLF